MSRAIDALQAAGLIAAIGIALAFGKNIGDYAAPTGAEIENDINSQRAHLCEVDGWPSDSKIAYERACKSELRRKST
jgi:hypothetical protein